MQPQSPRKVRWPKLFLTRLRLPLAASITIVFLLTFFSPKTQSESNATIGIEPAACPAELVKNGDFELGNPDSSPLDWAMDQWRPSAYFSRDATNAHSGTSSVKITAPEVSDARFLQDVTVASTLLCWITEAQEVLHAEEVFSRKGAKTPSAAAFRRVFFASLRLCVRHIS